LWQHCHVFWRKLNNAGTRQKHRYFFAVLSTARYCFMDSFD
jgi:hypothetical protein